MTSFEEIGYSVFLSIDANSTGSGYRLTADEENYLITAKHVLYDEQDRLRGETLLISCQTPGGLEKNLEIHNIDLKSAKIHFNLAADIAIVYLGVEHEGQIIFENYVSTIQKGFIKTNSINTTRIKSASNIKMGAEIFLVGYPTSLLFGDIGGFDIRTPILRRGIIAGLYNNSFIIDCPAYYGNSGAPVIERQDNGDFNLVGTISRYVPFASHWMNSREPLIHVEYLNSGYTVCIATEHVLQLIEELRKF